MQDSHYNQSQCQRYKLSKCPSRRLHSHKILMFNQNLLWKGHLKLVVKNLLVLVKVDSKSLLNIINSTCLYNNNNNLNPSKVTALDSHRHHSILDLHQALHHQQISATLFNLPKNPPQLLTTNSILDQNPTMTHSLKSNNSMESLQTIWTWTIITLLWTITWILVTFLTVIILTNPKVMILLMIFCDFYILLGLI